jgi:translation initiation factor IF-3
MEVFCINKNVSMNEGIRVKEIRLSGGDESRIMKTSEALEMAIEAGMDLVMISPSAVPPVCRIMDYSKFLFEQAKKEKEAKKNQKIVDLKEIRLSATIEEHDIEIKARNAKKFLTNGDKIKVSIRFKGRQNNYTNAGSKVLEHFVSKLDDLGVVEKAPKLEGKNLFMVISAKK